MKHLNSSVWIQSWAQMALVKSSYYKASANHSTATVLHGSDKYGDEVA